MRGFYWPMRSNMLRWAQRRFPKDAGAGGSASFVSSQVSVGDVRHLLLPPMFPCDVCRVARAT